MNDSVIYQFVSEFDDLFANFISTIRIFPPSYWSKTESFKHCLW